MFDVAQACPPMQRALGRAWVGLAMIGGAVRLRTLEQAGSAKAFLPSVHSPVPEIVFLNTAGGLASGDRLEFGVGADDGVCLAATTQTAERAYRADHGPAHVTVNLHLGQGAQVDWLPQETILYDGASLNRRTRVDLAGDGRVTLCEIIVLGRAAMGENVAALKLTDRREVWSRALPVWIDAFGLDDAALAPRPALLAGARAIATLALIGSGAEDAVGPVRAALAEVPGVSGHASGWDGKCVARLAGAESFHLKRAVARVLGVLRRGAPLPRVWQV
jgi:urease accessory protein